MLHMVMRQRRRFAFALLLTQLALIGVVPQLGIIVLMIVGLFFGIGLVLASGHPVRRLVECGAIGLLAASRVPGFTAMALTFVGATALAYIVLYSPLLDRVPVRIGLSSRKTFNVAMDKRTAWSKLIPGQGHVAAYWTGRMIAARQDDHDDCTFYVTSDNGDGTTEDITITYLQLQPYRHATYLMERDSLVHGEEVMMTYDLVQTEDERTFISSHMRVSGLPFRYAVERFFDDVLGDELDSFATMTECRRSWTLKDPKDVSLTNHMGRASVTLSVTLEGDVPDIAEEPETPAKRRLTA